MTTIFWPLNAFCAQTVKATNLSHLLFKKLICQVAVETSAFHYQWLQHGWGSSKKLHKHCFNVDNRDSVKMIHLDALTESASCEYTMW